MDSLKDWLPIRIWQEAEEWRVDWCWFGERKLDQPFFRDAVDEALRLPFNQAFRRETPLAVLCEWQMPAVEPTAFVYHASRCGSTLIGQMLAQLDEAIVISEPPPLDALLRGTLDPEVRNAALRGLLAAYGQIRRGTEQKLVIKLDAWNIGELPLLRECFPDVPWMFVYREPLEIAVSHIRRAGMHMVPGIIGPSSLDGESQGNVREDYIAQRLGRILDFGLEYCRAFAGLPVNYRELPGAMQGHLADFFGLDAAQCSKALLATVQHAKQPGQVFVADSRDKHREATDLLKDRIECWTRTSYEALEVLRGERSLNRQA
ncbi:sulfotransferase family protein [Pseudomonas cichorii]|uniref:sulfotransferase family protein n=1 Tax=Pseudomonas cichorii TaxID=36746 RepID=UPI001C8AF372|nr:sulfotransferase family protein [Pseudomonas cichorii]MBX8486037.1 sulfotransferase family protein [Pseudomonas cichorii]